MEVQSASHAGPFPPSGIEVRWSPVTTESMGEKLARLVVREDDVFWPLSSECLRSFSELRQGERYLACGGTGGSKVDFEEEDGAPAQKLARVEAGRFVTGDPDGAGVSSTVARKTKTKAIEVANSELMETMRILMMKHDEAIKKHDEAIKKHDEEINLLKASHEAERGRLSNLISFQEKTGNSPTSAAYALAEFAVNAGGAILRRRVALSCLNEFFEIPVSEALAVSRANLLGTRWMQEVVINDILVHTQARLRSEEFPRALERFRTSFSEGFIEDVDFCRAAVWEFNETGTSLAAYWRSRSYNPKKPLCSDWNKKPRKAGQKMSEDLKGWLRATEEELAGNAGVAPEMLRVFIGAYSTAARHQRNADSHFFSIFGTVTRSEKRAASAEPSRWEDFSERLKAAQKTPLRVTPLDELQRMYWALRQLQHQVPLLDSFFQEHSEAFLGLLKMLESEYLPELVHSSIKEAENKAEAREKAARFGVRFEDGCFRKAGAGTFKYVREPAQGGQVLMQFKEEENAFVPDPDAWKLLLGC